MRVISNLLLAFMLTTASGSICAQPSALSRPKAQGTAPSQILSALVGRSAPTTEMDLNLDGVFDFADLATALLLSGGLPPDPGDVAPELPQDSPPSFVDSTRFIFEGPLPIQTGVEDGAVDPTRQSVMRGLVLDFSGAPLPGVRVSVHGHPEFGQTLTRADGLFDMVVNGGDLVRLRYDKEGFFEGQRQIRVPIQDYTFVPDIALLGRDSQVTTVSLSQLTGPAIHTASVSADLDGPRQPHVCIPPGRTAEMVMPDGSRTPLDTLSIRVTEFTVGPMGAKAMPAQLPPTTTLTYCAEFSADEAVTAGATRIDFSEPLFYYVANYTEAPVGSAIPTGFFDREAGVWKAEPDGICLKVVGIAGGAAQVDGDGDGVAEDQTFLDRFSLTDAELHEIAGIYGVNDTFWRGPLAHFSLWDLNPQQSITVDPVNDFAPDDKPPPEGPADPEGGDEDNIDDPSECKGSIISVENQSLGQEIGIANTPYSLRYESSRALGRRDAYTLRVPLTGTEVPVNADSITVDVTIAGRQFIEIYRIDALPPDNTHRLVWDGLDAYGRRVNGRVPAKVELTYTYPVILVYCVFDEEGVPRSFSRSRIDCGVGKHPLEEIHWRRKTSTRFLQIGSYVSPDRDLGGWTLDAHHAFDPTSKILSMGDGHRQHADALPLFATPLSGEFPVTGHIVAGPDGMIYLLSAEEIYRRAPDGQITTHPGGVFAHISLALGLDGRLYYGSDNRSNTLRPYSIYSISGNFIESRSTRIAGLVSGLPQDPRCNECPALTTRIGFPRDLAFGPDGSLYTCSSDTSGIFPSRIRRFTPEGFVSDFAGTGGSGTSPLVEDVPALQAGMTPRAIDVNDRGELYLVDSLFGGIIRKVDTNGIITSVTGTSGFDSPFEFVPAREAHLESSQTMRNSREITVAPDDTLYVSGTFIEAITPKRRVTTIAGLGGTGTADFVYDTAWLDSLQPRLAREARLGFVRDLDVGPDGNLYLLATNGFLDVVGRIVKIGPPVPEATAGEIVIPSPTGTEIFVFNLDGRHLRTLDANSRATLRTFHYDAGGRVVSVTGFNGLVTTLERNAGGVVTGILDPRGTRTVLGRDAAGLIATVTDPAQAVWRAGYDSAGLLQSFTDPDGNVKTYVFDAEGRLTEEHAPENDFRTLSTTGQEGESRLVGFTTPQGTTTHAFVQGRAGRSANTTTSPAGAINRSQTFSDGSERIETADGMITVRTALTDPAGNSGQLTGRVDVTTPSGLASASVRERVTGETVGAAKSFTDTTTINGRLYTVSFDADLNQVTRISPEGRQSVHRFDSAGRLAEFVEAGRIPAIYTHDSLGRILNVKQTGPSESRETVYTYDGPLSPPASITTTGGNALSMSYDSVGRPQTIGLNGAFTTAMAYSGAGMLGSITPPGRPATGYFFDGLHRLREVRRPVSGGGTESTMFAYNALGSLATATLPGGEAVTMSYDELGRPGAIAQTLARTTFDFTGQTCCIDKPRPAAMTRTALTPDGRIQTLAYGYDGSLVTRVDYSGEVAGSVAITYDANLVPTAYAVNGGAPISYLRDGDLLVKQAGDLAITRFAQSPGASGSTLGVVTTTRAETPFGEESEFTASVSGAAALRLVYTRDSSARVTRLVETVQGVTTTRDFQYDSGARLARETRDGAATDHTYDSTGNRLTRAAESGTYDVQDRMLTYGAASYEYNARGQLKKKTIGAAVTAYTYDAYNALTKVVLPDARVIEYAIDPQNRRVAKYIDGVKQQAFLYRSRLQVEAVLDGTGSVAAQFVYGMKSNVPDAMLKAGKWHQIISDEVGSVRLVIDSVTGEVAQRLDYDAYGRILQDTNPGFQPFGFGGGIYDAETGLIRFVYRDYDPESGRFTAPDPLGFRGGDLNLYTYGQGDPVNHLDPSGLQTKLSPAACQEIAKVLKLEDEIGTWDTARKCSNTVGERCLSSFDGSGGGGPVETAVGEVDLDWFTDLIYYGGGNLFELPSPQEALYLLAEYLGGKLIWNAQRLSDGYDGKINAPFADPGEREALTELLFGNDTFAELFPPEWMAANCPKECPK